MITIKSNIEFLENHKKWLKDVAENIKADCTYNNANIEYAIETLKMIDQLKDDAWDEKRADVVGANGNDGLHYE